jgi:hypothetical protein
MTEEQNAIAKWMSGKKTYFVAGTILACGILATQGIEIPEFVWASLAALGLGFLRAGVAK